MGKLRSRRSRHSRHSRHYKKKQHTRHYRKKHDTKRRVGRKRHKSRRKHRKRSRRNKRGGMNAAVDDVMYELLNEYKGELRKIVDKLLKIVNKDGVNNDKLNVENFMRLRDKLNKLRKESWYTNTDSYYTQYIDPENFLKNFKQLDYIEDVAAEIEDVVVKEGDVETEIGEPLKILGALYIYINGTPTDNYDNGTNMYKTFLEENEILVGRYNLEMHTEIAKEKLLKMLEPKRALMHHVALEGTRVAAAAKTKREAEEKAREAKEKARWEAAEKARREAEEDAAEKAAEKARQEALAHPEYQEELKKSKAELARLKAENLADDAGEKAEEAIPEDMKKKGLSIIDDEEDRVRRGPVAAPTPPRARTLVQVPLSRSRARTGSLSRLSPRK